MASGEADNQTPDGIQLTRVRGHAAERFEVLQDISIAANEYLLRGFDAFERCVLTNWRLDDHERQHFLEGSMSVFKHLKGKLDYGIGTFENDALRTCFYVHPASIDQEDDLKGASASYTLEDEQRYSQDVEGLVEAIKEMRIRLRRLTSEKQELERCLALSGDAAALEAITQVCALKEGVADDAAALVEGGLRLGPLLAHAEALEKDIYKTDAEVTPLRGIENIEREMQKRQAKAGGASEEDIQALRALFTAAPPSDENQQQPAQ
eukprot:jgi/Botrbrau1/4268/Bobra.0390s0008.1